MSARPLLLAELGWLALMQGNLATAMRLAAEAADLAEDLVNRRVRSHALRLKGETLLRRGDAGPATVALDEALVVAEESGALTEVAAVRLSQAHLASEDERPVAALRLVGGTPASSIPPHAMRLTSPGWIRGMSFLGGGDLDAAGREFADDFDAAMKGRVIRHQANSLDGSARVMIATGELGRAAENHRRALEWRRRIGDRLGVVESLIGVARVAAVSAPAGAALLLGQALALRDSMGAGPTRRQAADIAAVLALVHGHGDRRSPDRRIPGGEDGNDEDVATALAIQLADLVRRSPTRSRRT